MRMVRLGTAMLAGVALCSAWGVGLEGALAQGGQRWEQRQPMPQRERGMEQPGQRFGMQPQPSRFMGQQGRITPDLRRALANHNADVNSPISSDRAQELTQAWRVETEGNVTHEPIFDRGRVYFADWNGNVYCVEQETGEEVWRREVGEPNTDWPWHGFVGTGALSDGGDVLFLASVEGRAYAIDTESGETIWEQPIADDEHAGNTGKLLQHGGVVYIGLSSVEEILHERQEGFEPDFRGRVMALDAQSGEVVWSASLVQEPSNGVPVWGGFALDPDTRTLYFATGNNYTGEPSSLSNAVLAVDAESGELLWAQQTTPNDVWTMANPQGPGLAFTTAPQLFNAQTDGQLRRLVGAGQKSGTFWVWDRQSGEPVWSTNVGYGHIGGGIFAEASIGRDRIIICGNNAYAFENPGEHPLDVKAVDIRTGAPRWVAARAQPAQLMSTGFLAGDVYFAGSLDGRVRAYNAQDGEEVWTSQQHASIASPINVEGEMVCFGTGLPELMGGREGEGRGVFCYHLGGQGEEARGTDQGDGQRARLRPAAARPQNQRAPRGGNQAQGGAIRVVAQNMAFEPSEITVAPGQQVTIALVNQGSAPHSIDFELPGREAELERALPPNERGTLTFTAPREPGRYTFYCPVGNHRELGMEGTLIVREQQQPQQQPQQQRPQQQQRPDR